MQTTATKAEFNPTVIVAVAFLSRPQALTFLKRPQYQNASDDC